MQTQEKYNWSNSLKKNIPLSYDENGIQRDEFGRTAREWQDFRTHKKKTKEQEKENIKNGINNIQFYYKKNNDRFNITPYKSIKVYNNFNKYDARQTKEYKYLLNEYFNHQIESFNYFNYTLKLDSIPYYAFHSVSIYRNQKYKHSTNDLHKNYYIEFKKAKEKANILNPYKFKELNNNVFTW